MKAVLSAFVGHMTKFQLAERQTPDLDAELAALEDEDGEGIVGDEDVESEEEEGEVEDGDELAPEVRESDETVVDEVADEADLEHRLPSLSLRDAKAGQIALTKLRKLAQKIHWSLTICEALAEDCEAVNVWPRHIVRDVSTRWNSSTELIHSVLLIEKALSCLVIRKEFNRPRGVRLERFMLSRAEWEILKGIKPLLDAILYATKEVSQSAVPMVHPIIPLINSITAIFDKFIDNLNSHPAVCHAAFRGLLMLNKYYKRTDDAVVYQIAMLMHSSTKTSYFIRAGWSAEWIGATVTPEGRLTLQKS
ncbi:hypothetical protein CC1G_11533 [Coprinopsis cinerea okayama7|uniref:Uncharacterized protein n=1 Tax=Coprinopsis cinerea (strain Okayama-7 / 130 / ATCC MYA-4618 / FGSC 9003) TaxID=240176 RepID=A8N6R9_COPC7|nr:hypothetical protein CC1G_11533 [Coprinopsis cinerea okayama7\|eukprot:XP_001830525.1 hypothetical protein CC1G_11533 [Coprinopsis cinerea okayama7\